MYIHTIGYFFNITKRRYERLVDRIKTTPLVFRVEGKEFRFDQKTFRILRSTKNDHNITCQAMEEISEVLEETEGQIQKLETPKQEKERNSDINRLHRLCFGFYGE